MKHSTDRHPFILLLMVAALLALPTLASAGAQWMPVKDVHFNTQTSLADNLKGLTGKRVELSLASGSSIAGTVESVGAASVHLSKVSGKEAYDALVPLDKVTAVQVRFRTLGH